MVAKGKTASPTRGAPVRPYLSEQELPIIPPKPIAPKMSTTRSRTMPLLVLPRKSSADQVYSGVEEWEEVGGRRNRVVVKERMAKRVRENLRLRQEMPDRSS